MSTSNSSSYINDEDQNRTVLNSLFSFSNYSRIPKPYSKRNLPDSFYRPPSVNTKNKYVHRQHTKSQSSLPDIPINMKSINKPCHSRTVSDTAVLIEQNTIDSKLSQINSQSSILPLPDDWEEKQTSDGQIYYIEYDKLNSISFPFSCLVMQVNVHHGLIHVRNITQHFNHIVRHFHYLMVMNKCMIQQEIFILLIIKINKLIGMIQGLVKYYFYII